MKFYTNIVLILVCIFSLSSNQKPAKVNTNNTKVVAATAEIITKEPVKTSKDEIVGTYYVDRFYNYLRSGFELKIDKPTDYFTLYTFEFKQNGDIIFKDLTKSYGCGNGIMSIKKGTWKVNADGSYELTFDGEYAFQSKFHSESIYKLATLKNGNIKMKLTKVIVNKRKASWN